MHAVSPNLWTVERAHVTGRYSHTVQLVIVGRDLEDGWRVVPTLAETREAPWFTHAREGEVCGFRHGYSGRCRAGETHDPAPAIHVTARDLPIADAGTPLCASHSPWDRDREAY